MPNKQKPGRVVSWKVVTVVRKGGCVCVDLCCQEEIQISALQGGSEHFWIALPNKDRPDFAVI